jgi:hypothetical protein
MSRQITTPINTSGELKKIARKIRPAEDRVLALSHFNAEYEVCRGDLNKMDPETISSAIHATGVDSLTMLAKGYVRDDRTYILALAEQFIEEYDCKKASEKATAQLAARAFTNVMVLSFQISEIDTKEVGQYNALSKELDRANRQYIQAIKLLRTLKQPNITVNVKTNEAYFAHNQQINHGAK